MRRSSKRLQKRRSLSKRKSPRKSGGGRKTRKSLSVKKRISKGGNRPSDEGADPNRNENMRLTRPPVRNLPEQVDSLMARELRDAAQAEQYEALVRRLGEIAREEARNNAQQ